MMQLGIFGTSGFAREVADVAVECGYAPVFIAKNESERGDWVFSDTVILEEELPNTALTAFAIGVGDNNVRRKIAERYKPRLDFINLVHPSVTFGRNQREFIERCVGVIVCAGVRFTNNIQVGDFSIFNLNSTIGHDVVIEDFVHIAPGVSISGNVHLRACAYIGTGVTIKQGTPSEKLVIGQEVMIGAGANVTRHCDSRGIYVGNPAKRM